MLFVLGVGWYRCDDDFVGWLSALQSISCFRCDDDFVGWLSALQSISCYTKLRNNFFSKQNALLCLFSAYQILSLSSVPTNHFSFISGFDCTYDVFKNMLMLGN